MEVKRGVAVGTMVATIMIVSAALLAMYYLLYTEYMAYHELTGYVLNIEKPVFHITRVEYNGSMLIVLSIPTGKFRGRSKGNEDGLVPVFQFPLGNSKKPPQRNPLKLTNTFNSHWEIPDDDAEGIKRLTGTFNSHWEILASDADAIRAALDTFNSHWEIQVLKSEIGAWARRWLSIPTGKF